MKLFEHGALCLAALLGLSSAAWAAPRVAIVTPLSGEVQLAGATMKGPKIAEEGQHVVVGAGGQVRIQLLGSSKEKLIKGQADYKISKAALENEGKVLSRGEVSVVAAEIGSLARAGAAASRPASYKPVGLALQLPPKPQGKSWTALVLPAKAKDPNRPQPKYPISLTLTDLTDSQAEQETIWLKGPQAAVPFASLIEGHQYSLFVQPDQGDDYERRFRLLTREEQQALDATEKALRLEAIETQELPTLLRLASLYHSFDQTEKMEQVLMKATYSPEFRKLDPEVQRQLVSALNDARRSLDMADFQPAK